MARVSPKIRDAVISLSLLMLSFLGVIKYMNDDIKHLIHYTKDRVNILGFFLLIILLVFCIDGRIEIKQIKCRRGFITGWMLCFGMMLVMAFVHPVVKGYFLWTIISLAFVIPFAIIWQERGDFEHLCNVVASAVLTAAGVFFVLNLVLVPFADSIQVPAYWGLAKNPNNNGFICTGAYAAALYMMITGKKRHTTYAIIAGFCIAMSVASVCRTAELTIAAETFVGVAYYLVIARRTEERVPVKKALITIGIIAVVAIASKYVLMRIDSMDLNVYAAEDIEMTSEVEQSSDLGDSLENLSSGRLAIWKAFISHSTFWGNGNKTKGQQIEGVEASIYAHNNALEILYSSGVIALVGYLIWIVSGLIFVLRCLMGKYGYHKSYILVVMAFTGYFIQAMLEILIYPMCNIPTMMMYVCLMPIIINTREEDIVE